DRLEGRAANNVWQGSTVSVPGSPTGVEQPHPPEDVRSPCARRSAPASCTVLAANITAFATQTHAYCFNTVPLCAFPMPRGLYAEIASIEEQHVTQYGCLQDPDESPLEKWLIQEATEAYLYRSCAESEPNPRSRAIWERFLDYELGHLQLARKLFEDHERRDAAEVLSSTPALLKFQSQRDFVRQVLDQEVGYRVIGTEFNSAGNESERTLGYRASINADGSPSQAVAAGYRWRPGTE